MTRDRFNHFERWARAKIGANEVVAYTGSSATTGANKAPGLYRIVCTTDAHISQGTNPLVATTSDMPLFIGQEAYATVDADASGGDPPDEAANSDNRFAAIRMTASGNMHITLISRLTEADI